MKRWINHYDIDISHFGGQGSHTGRSPNIVYTRERLEEAVQASRTMSEVCRYLGRPVTGGTSTHLRRVIARHKINTSHFLTRSESSRLLYQPNFTLRTSDTVFVVLPPGSGREKVYILRREMLAAGVAHQCAVCRTGAVWNDVPLVLHIDHINGNYLDNRLINLRFLCPNCHSQQPTSKDKRRRYFPDATAEVS